mgnify:CR=1 FL=1
MLMENLKEKHRDVKIELPQEERGWLFLNGDLSDTFFNCFQCSSSLCVNLYFHLVSFLFCLKDFFNISCSAGLLAINSFTFCLLENV